MICPGCSQAIESGSEGGYPAACPGCGHKIEQDRRATDEKRILLFLTSCPKCGKDLIATDASIADSRFGKCSSCGFVFLLAADRMETVLPDHEKVPSAQTLIPFRGDQTADTAEQLTGESTNVDSGIRTRPDQLVPALVCESPPMRVPLIRERILIGRVKADLDIDSPDISRRHAVIERRNDRYFIRDLGSTNGTYVNGRKIEESPLEGGDRLVVGQTVFYVRTGESGEGIYLLLAMAPLAESGRTAESQRHCAQAFGVALAKCFGERERDVLSSEVTGRSLAIFPFDDTVSGEERDQLARSVLSFARIFNDSLEQGTGDEGARVAVALGPARRIVEEGKSKLSGEIIQRVASLFKIPEPLPGSGVIDESSLLRLLSPGPGETVDEILSVMGYQARPVENGPTGALFVTKKGREAPTEKKRDAAREMEELWEKARVGVESEIAHAFSGKQSGGGKLAKKLGQKAVSMRLRSNLYRELLSSPVFLTRELVLGFLHHLEEGGRTLERFAPIKTLMDEEDLFVTAYALRLLASAAHALPDLRDLDLCRLTRAAGDYLRAAEPKGAGEAGHPLQRVLEIYDSAKNGPRDEVSPSALFEFMAMLAFIRAIRTHGGRPDLDKAKKLLAKLQGYGRLWNQMLRE